ncbi:MAG: hypothetical protein RBT11_00080 [Desulfobacterales bacterium]|jgi:cell shape-determining protein MreD|nr:hypothetical protein [Desulfobacterales bacterium]
MLFLLNMMIGFALVIFQTALVPKLPLIDNCFDLLLPFVIYQGVFRPVREGLVLVVVVGLLMDRLSGAPIGLLAIIYLWIWVGIRWGVRFFHVGNYYLVPFFVTLAVLLENALFAMAHILFAGEANYSMVAGGTVLGQVGWAIISAPLFMMLLNAVHHGWAAWVSNINEE